MSSNENSNNPVAAGNGNTAADKATGAAKFVTGALGNTLGGVGRTVGNVTGAAGKGVGDTINSVTGDRAKFVGDGVSGLGTGIQSGLGSVSQSVENAGQWKLGSGAAAGGEEAKEGEKKEQK
ncbi:hypothetical protein ISF_05593 [Cordyceps fumosorosea ARSEF 2679]|uniref:Uncharacterized protein n=1 Tax=Cordyceps fumosorosea (strain ARSEF 2679) TaxID=1081104 RepID=A0A167UES4_CORFA|nr:hypothetical protein ISF_05593 [Cordyceps fumosorosea ARSEF 2679]OAA61514.1 hypothetical protein ISF_05593 [Cordyceps fumosorosea ARSEF 2679]